MEQDVDEKFKISIDLEQIESFKEHPRYQYESNDKGEYFSHVEITTKTGEKHYVNKEFYPVLKEYFDKAGKYYMTLVK